jgi:hypothetical protein
MRPAVRRAVFAAAVAALAIEYHTRVHVAPFPNAPAPLYRVLATQPAGVVAEFPMPDAAALPGSEPDRAYMSSFAWYRTVNGYSGNYPPSFLSRLDRLTGFPDARALAQLRRDGVRYVIVHASAYSDARLTEIRLALRDGGVAELGQFEAMHDPAYLYQLR